MNQEQATGEQIDCTHLPYQQTGYFSKTILDYISSAPTLQPFYKHPVSLDGIKASIEQRKLFPQNRSVLVDVLKKQYAALPFSKAVSDNVDLLSQPNTFTITTAHQPVIFTGPLYFAYKILHAVKLAADLSKQIPDAHFVPVFYMGSEDADLDELGTFSVDGKEYQWKTKQTGAVGRMKVDNEFVKLMNDLDNQISVLPFGNELMQIFKNCYRPGITIQQASLELVHELFGEFGVVVLVPDQPELKALLAPVFLKEIDELFSHQKVEETVDDLSKEYKVQAGGRELNLFYLIDDKRERIEKQGDLFVIQNIGKTFTKAELEEDIKDHPERISPNVILRGVLQETVLPNIAFIGGGGELAYWLELKKVSEAVAVPYPVLILRNSFLFITEKQAQKIAQLDFAPADFFSDSLSLINTLVTRTSQNSLSLQSEKEELNNWLNEVRTKAAAVDVTLAEHTEALSAQFQKKIMALEKKIVRAERRKRAAEHRQIETLKQQLFPRKSLQERVENISGWYGRYGKNFLRLIYENSLSLDPEFTIVTL